jgi:hypothetical protein
MLEGCDKQRNVNNNIIFRFSDERWHLILDTRERQAQIQRAEKVDLVSIYNEYITTNSRLDRGLTMYVKEGNVNDVGNAPKSCWVARNDRPLLIEQLMG